MIVKLPNKYKMGDRLRIGPNIYTNVLRIGHWHLVAQED